MHKQWKESEWEFPTQQHPRKFLMACGVATVGILLSCGPSIATAEVDVATFEEFRVYHQVQPFASGQVYVTPVR